jgi:hypothetical protein
MQPRRNYTVPFWSLLIFTVIWLALFVSMVYNLSQNEYFQPFLRSYIPKEVIRLLVLIAETLAYWYMRKLKYRRFLALWHVGLWYAFFILMPAIMVGVQFYIEKVYTGQQEQGLRSVKSAVEVFFWVGIIVGHVFFAIAIVEGIRNRRKEKALGESEFFESV